MKLFDKNSGLNKFTNITGNLIKLNLCFLLLCLPVLTIPAALTAMDATALRIVRGKDFEAGVFFSDFKANFKAATLTGLIAAVVIGMLLIDVRLVNKGLVELSSGPVYVMYALLFIAIATVSYLFPMVAQFENTTVQYIKNSLLFSMRYLPKTVIMVTMNLLPIVIGLSSIKALIYMAPIYILVMFAFSAYFNMRTIRPVFDAYIEDGEIENR